MFSAKNPAGKASPLQTTFISPDCQLQGELLLNCDTRVDGQIQGKLQCSKAVMIGASGQLQGAVSAALISVHGHISGTLYADRVEILASGYVEGDIYTDSLSIEPGGRFLGETHSMPAATDRPQLAAGSRSELARTLNLSNNPSN